MDWKKLTFSDQFCHARRNVLSVFGLGLVVSLILLTLLYFDQSSSKPLLLNQMFQGFNSSCSGSSSTSANLSSELEKSVDLMQRIEEANNMERTHEGIVSNIGKGANFSNFIGTEMVFNETNLGNLSKNVIDGSFTVGEGSNDGNSSSHGERKGFIDTEERNLEDAIRISSYESQLRKTKNGFNGKCDIFDGRWVRDDSKPYYPARSCPLIDRDFDCHLNGRREDGFLRWKWQPNGCEIPSMNAIDFLEKLRGKKLVFVGDSLNRNMWESLVCILRHSIRNKKRVYEISGRNDFKKKGFYAFRFEDYNCTVDFVSSPFLVRESFFKGKNGLFETLRLDLMDRTTSMYYDADILIFNTGHWWTHEKTSRGEDYYQEGNYVHPRLKVLKAYKRALSTWATWVDKNIDPKRTRVIFRGYSVTHFRGGQWNSGGQCHKETQPIFNQTYLSKYPTKMRALESVLKEMKTPVIYLNISRLTDYRKDGHPSIYRKEYKTVQEQVAAEQSQDCSHWCLPGVPDTWNELLYASLLMNQ